MMWLLSAVNGVMPSKRKEGEVSGNKIGTLGYGTNVFEKMAANRKGRLRKRRKQHCVVMSMKPIEKKYVIVKEI